MSDYFLGLKTKAGDERVVLLLEYLGKSEAFMAEYLEKYRKTAPKRIMNSWVKYVPWLPTDIYCECRQIPPIHFPRFAYVIRFFGDQPGDPMFFHMGWYSVNENTGFFPESRQLSQPL